MWPSQVKGSTLTKSETLKNYSWTKYTRNPEKFMGNLVMNFTNIAGLSSDDVQHWEYVINGGSEISILKLTKL